MVEGMWCRDDKQSTGSQNANGFGDRLTLLADVLEHLDHRDGVVLAVRDGQRAQVSLPELAAFGHSVSLCSEAGEGTLAVEMSMPVARPPALANATG